MTVRDLSDAEVEEIGEYLDYCVDIATSTDRLDRDKVEASLNRLYQAHGLTMPRFVWVPRGLMSSLFILAWIILDEDDNRLTKIIGSMDRFDDEIERLCDLADAIHFDDIDQLPEDEQHLLSTVLGAVGIADFKKAVSTASSYPSLSAGQELLWTAFYKKAIEFDMPFPDDLKRRLLAIINMGETAHHVWALGEICIACDRPTALNYDEEYRLHGGESTVAMQYPNENFRLRAWRNIVFTKDPNTMTPQEILNLANTEERRAAIEWYGWGRFLVDLGVSPVDVGPDPGNFAYNAATGQMEQRELRLYDVPDVDEDEDEPSDGRLLVMINGSPDRDGRDRVYGEMVPRSCNTVLEAVAWQHPGVSPEVYALTARRT